MDARRRVHVGAVWTGDDHAASARPIADGRIVDWNYDVWSQSHNMRPGDPDGINLLASWYMADPKKPGPARQAAQPSGAGDRNAIPLYDLPRQRITHHLITENPIRTSALRTLGAYANVFAVESFMDELAAAAGVDPVAFRLAHLKDPRVARRDRGGGQGRRLEARREGRRQARARHCFRTLQDDRHLCRGRGRDRGRSRQRPGAGCRARGPRSMPARSSIPTA